MRQAASGAFLLWNHYGRGFTSQGGARFHTDDGWTDDTARDAS